MLTATEDYLEQVAKLQLITAAGLPPEDYLEGGVGAEWFLIQFDGLRALLRLVVTDGKA